jgi:hypothetical protein
MWDAEHASFFLILFVFLLLIYPRSPERLRIGLRTGIGENRSPSAGFSSLDVER